MIQICRTSQRSGLTGSACAVLGRLHRKSTSVLGMLQCLSKCEGRDFFAVPLAPTPALQCGSSSSSSKLVVCGLRSSKHDEDTVRVNKPSSSSNSTAELAVKIMQLHQQHCN
eukprot:11156-Heterococcus_DN1.PRE.2